MCNILTCIKEKIKSICSWGRGNKENTYVNICKENNEQKLKIEDGVKQNKIIIHNEITETINERNEKYEKEENIEQNGQIVKYGCNAKTEPIKETNNKNQFKNGKFLLINELYGFINNGNNCYLNSSLQLLTRVKELRINILNFKYENICSDSITEGKIYIEFKNIIQDINNGKKTIDPRKLKKVMGMIDERYKDNNQEDANEFISNFLDGLLNEIGDKNNLPEPLNINNESDQIAYNKFYNRFYKKKGNSFLLDLFYSILKTQKVCKNCGKVNSIKFNAYNIIELPIINLCNKGNDIQFEDIIYNYFKKNENIDGECNNCGKNAIYEKINIYSLPKYLIFYFGRTVDNFYLNNTIIYHDKYTFESFKNNDIDYNLECVIEHSGGAHFGHYTSLCPINKTNNWYKFNDDNFCESHTTYKGQNAIILLYNKKD